MASTADTSPPPRGKDPYDGDAGARLIRDTLIDRGRDDAERRMLNAESDSGVDWWMDYCGPMIDRVELTLYPGDETFYYVVRVEADTKEQADEVMANRIHPDEDLGFPYQIDFSEQGAVAPLEPEEQS